MIFKTIMKQLKGIKFLNQGISFTTLNNALLCYVPLSSDLKVTAECFNMYINIVILFRVLCLKISKAILFYLYHNS